MRRSKKIKAIKFEQNKIIKKLMIILGCLGKLIILKYFVL